MKIVFALDSFKGSLSSMAAGAAAAEGARRALPDAVTVVRPLADGGEGTVDALVDGLGGRRVDAVVTGPLGAPVTATYGILPDGVTAVIEMAAAAGLPLVPSDQRDPRITTTFGVGELIVDALARGCRRFLVGIGGSATNDGGAGMLQALGFDLRAADGTPIPRGGAGLVQLARIDASGGRPELAACEFRVACDVVNPLCGPTGASAVFGPQKGASPAAVAELDAALAHYADVAGAFCRTTDAGFAASVPGDGAAGGLGFAFRAFLRARLERGVEIVLAETRLEEQLADADVVVTGEGRLDAQTAMGKAPIGVAQLAKRHGCRVIAFAGCTSSDAGLVNAHGIDAFFPILRAVTTLDEALDPVCAAANLAATSEQAFRLFSAAAARAIIPA